MRIGFHVSIMGSIDKAVSRAVERGYTTFQIFTSNPRQWKPKELTAEETKAFVEKVNSNDVKPVFAHMPYLPNLASPKDIVYAKSCETLISELERCSRLKIPYLVASFFGGTGLLIIVGVMLDTMRQIESHLLMRHYEGFMKKGRIKGRR